MVIPYLGESISGVAIGEFEDLSRMHLMQWQMMHNIWKTDLDRCSWMSLKTRLLKYRFKEALVVIGYKLSEYQSVWFTLMCKLIGCRIAGLGISLRLWNSMTELGHSSIQSLKTNIDCSPTLWCILHIKMPRSTLSVIWLPVVHRANKRESCLPCVYYNENI